MQTEEIRFDSKLRKKVVKAVVLAGSRLGVVLGTDFPEHPSAWNQSSAFRGELLILEPGIEIARRSLNGA